MKLIEVITLIMIASKLGASDYWTVAMLLCALVMFIAET